jgi:hypothetical protein
MGVIHRRDQSGWEGILAQQYRDPELAGVRKHPGPERSRNQRVIFLRAGRPTDRRPHADRPDRRGKVQDEEQACT